ELGLPLPLRLRLLALAFELRLALPLRFRLAALTLQLRLALALRLLALPLELRLALPLGLRFLPLPFGLGLPLALRFRLPALALELRLPLPLRLRLAALTLQLRLPLGFLALVIDAREQRLVDDHRLDREHLRLRRTPHEIGAERECRNDRRVQRDGPEDGTCVFTQRRRHGCFRAALSRLWIQWIGDEADLARPRLLQQHHARHHAAVLRASLPLDPHQCLGLAADGRRRALDDRPIVDRRLDVLADVQVEPPFPVDAEHDRLVVAHQLGIERLRAGLRQ